MEKIVKIEAPMTEMVQSILATTEEFAHWPDSAEYHVEYRLKCWPMGFDDGHHVYFDNKDELDAWLEEKREWASLEDNAMSYYIERWDLGPVFHYSGQL